MLTKLNDLANCSASIGPSRLAAVGANTDKASNILGINAVTELKLLRVESSRTDAITLPNKFAIEQMINSKAANPLWCIETLPSSQAHSCLLLRAFRSHRPRYVGSANTASFVSLILYFVTSSGVARRIAITSNCSSVFALNSLIHTLG
jgi:hypothetical protein